MTSIVFEYVCLECVLNSCSLKIHFLTANELSTLEILQLKVYLKPKIIRFQFPMSKIKTQKEK